MVVAEVHQILLVVVVVVAIVRFLVLELMYSLQAVVVANLAG